MPSSETALRSWSPSSDIYSPDYHDNCTVGITNGGRHQAPAGKVRTLLEKDRNQKHTFSVASVSIRSAALLLPCAFHEGSELFLQRSSTGRGSVCSS